MFLLLQCLAFSLEKYVIKGGKCHILLFTATYIWMIVATVEYRVHSLST
jgi:hypothetical protein